MQQCFFLVIPSSFVSVCYFSFFFRNWFTIRQCHSLSSQCCTNTLSFFLSSFHLRALFGRLFCVLFNYPNKNCDDYYCFYSTFYYIKFDPAVIISFVLFHSYVVHSAWARYTILFKNWAHEAW